MSNADSSSSYFPCSASKIGNIMMIASATVADAAHRGIAAARRDSDAS
jgi:hypothetical protein